MTVTFLVSISDVLSFHSNVPVPQKRKKKGVEINPESTELK